MAGLKELLKKIRAPHGSETATSRRQSLQPTSEPLASNPPDAQAGEQGRAPTPHPGTQAEAAAPTTPEDGTPRRTGKLADVITRFRQRLSGLTKKKKKKNQQQSPQPTAVGERGSPSRERQAEQQHAQRPEPVFTNIVPPTENRPASLITQAGDARPEAARDIPRKPVVDVQPEQPKYTAWDPSMQPLQTVKEEQPQSPVAVESQPAPASGSQPSPETTKQLPPRPDGTIP